MSGDTIVVLPGTYSEKNLVKNGVNWHFFNGAVVNYSGAVGGGIFDTNTYGSACTFVVSGYGVFKVTSEPSPVPLVKSGFGGDNIKIECDRIEAIGSALDAAGTVLIRCNEMKSTSAPCVTAYTSANVTLYANKISSSGGHAIEISGGTVEVIARWISSTAGKGIRFNAGTLYVTAHEISSSTDYALEYNSAYSTLCRVHNARLVSTAGGGSGKAVYPVCGAHGLLIPKRQVARLLGPWNDVSDLAMFAAIHRPSWRMWQVVRPVLVEHVGVMSTFDETRTPQTLEVNHAA